MLTRILSLAGLTCLIFTTASTCLANDEDEAEPAATTESPAHHSIALLAGPTQVYNKKYRTYVSSLLNKEAGTYLSTYLRYQYQPDGVVRHAALDVELQNLSAKEKESYDGGTISVSYESAALVGGLRYFAQPPTPGWDHVAISIGVNGGFATSKIKVSSPTGEFEFTEKTDLIAGVVGGILYRVAMGAFVVGDLYLGARASLVAGAGYAF